MTYRKFATWEIDMGGTQNVKGLRSLLWTYEEEFGIRFRHRETRFTVRTSDLGILSEIERMLPELARVRHDYHRKVGTGNQHNLYPRDIELTEMLERFAVRLPGWLR